MDALLGKVFAHTPEGTGLAVWLTRRPGGGGQLVVADDGPGMPDLPVLQRGNSGTRSTGLGLDIVRRTARDAGGRVTVGHSESGGAHVAVEFGPPPHQPSPTRGGPLRRPGVRTFRPSVP